MHNYKELYAQIISDAKKANILIKDPNANEIQLDITLQNLEKNTYLVLDFIRQYLIMSSDTFYGSLYNQFDQVVDFKAKRITTLSLKMGEIKQVFNPLRFVDIRGFSGNSKEITFKNLCAFIVHDLFHLVKRHLQIFADCKTKTRKLKYYFDLATDIEINDEIKKEISLFNVKVKNTSLIEINDDLFTTSHTLQDMCEKENIRFKVMENKDYLYYLGILCMFKNTYVDDSEGQSEFNTSDDDFEQEGTKLDDNKEADIQHNPDLDNTDTHHQSHDDYYEQELDNDQLNAKVASVIRAAIDDAKIRGELTKHTKTIIEKLDLPAPALPINLINRATGRIPFAKKRDYRKERRGREFNPMLRGYKQSTINDIVVARDTSGSVSEHELKCFNIYIDSILKNRKHSIRIIDCDNEITKIQDVREMKSYEINGSGGTSFTPVVEYMNDIYTQNKVHEEIGFTGPVNDFKKTLLIYITDGHGESSIPIINNLYTIFVLTTSVDKLSIKELINADVVSLLDDPEWRLILTNNK